MILVRDISGGGKNKTVSTAEWSWAWEKAAESLGMAVPKPQACVLFIIFHATGLFTGHDPARGSGRKFFYNSRIESSRARRYWESPGSGRVGSGRVRGQEVVQISLVRSGRIDATPVKSPGITSTI